MWRDIPFPFTVTGVMARFWTAAVGVAAAEAARTAAMAKVFMMVVCELMILRWAGVWTIGVSDCYKAIVGSSSKQIQSLKNATPVKRV